MNQQNEKSCRLLTIKLSFSMALTTDIPNIHFATTVYGW